MIYTLLNGLVDRIKKGFTVYNCEASVSLGILNTGPGLIFPTLFHFSTVYYFLRYKCIMQLVFPDVTLGYSVGLSGSKFVFPQTRLLAR